MTRPVGQVGADQISVTGPYGAETVQEALDRSRQQFGGNFQIIDTLADLDYFAPADMAGERLISGRFWLSAFIALPAGEWCTFGETGVLSGVSAAACGLSGDIDGALLRGPVVARELAFDNTNPNATASMFDIYSTLGRAVRVEYCALGGGSKAGVISNVATNVVTIERTIVNGAPGGFLCTGVHIATEFLNCAWQGMPAGSIAIDVDAAAVIVLAMTIGGCSFITGDPTDRGVSVSDAATLPGGAPPSRVVGLSLLGNKNTGPGSTYDERPGTLDVDSPKLITSGNTNVIDSRYLGDADFEDYATPIALSYGAGPAPTPWQVVPSENVGPTTLLTLLGASAKFSLFRDPADPLKWYLQADGPTRQSVALTWNVSLESTGGGAAGNFLEYKLEKQASPPEAPVDPWVAAWSDVDGSTQRLEQRAQSSNNVHTTYDIADVGDRYRLVTRNFSGIGATLLQHYNLIAARA